MTICGYYADFVREIIDLVQSKFLRGQMLKFLSKNLSWKIEKNIGFKGLKNIKVKLYITHVIILKQGVFLFKVLIYVICDRGNDHSSSSDSS